MHATAASDATEYSTVVLRVISTSVALGSDGGEENERNMVTK